MLARVDVLDRDVDLREARAHLRARRRAVQPAAVGEPAPGLVDGGEVGVVAPVAGLQQLGQAGAVGARLGAEDAHRRAPPRVVELAGQPRRLGAGVLGHEVVPRRGSSRPATSVTASSSRLTRCGKASRKKPEMRSVTSIRGRPSSLERDHLQAGHPARGLVPRGPDAEQRQHLGRVVALGAHRRRAPGHQADHLRQLAGVVQMALQHGVGELDAGGVGELDRQRAGVDGVEVAPGREHVEPPAGRRAGRAGRDVAAAQRAQHVVQLVAGRRHARDDLLAPRSAARRSRRRRRSRARRGTRGPASPRVEQRGEQRLLGLLEPVEQVAAAMRRAGEALHQRGSRRRPAAPGAATSAASSSPNAAAIAGRSGGVPWRAIAATSPRSCGPSGT